MSSRLAARRLPPAEPASLTHPFIHPGMPTMKKLFALFAALVALSLCLPAHAANPVVEIQTSQGVIVAELYADRTPNTVANFLQYVREGFYNGTIFHRVIDGFMIQGGGFTPDMRQKGTRAPVQNEAQSGPKNTAGTLAMARTMDPHSATAQFFINLVDNPALDFRAPSGGGWGYAVFGKVTRGFDIVQKIGKQPTGNVGPFQNVPTTTVLIESMRILPEQK
jgi:cyclophilin family peptidyl-prolyl cis-trans isomerase